VVDRLPASFVRPNTETPDASRANDRRLKPLPKLKAAAAETLEPRRTNARKLKLEPTFISSITLHPPPIRNLAPTLKPLPSRATERTETEEPALKYSRMEALELNLAKDRRDKVDPKWAHCMTDNLEMLPIDTQLATDKVSAART
jgi:hypothetical protein